MKKLLLTIPLILALVGCGSSSGSDADTVKTNISTVTVGKDGTATSETTHITDKIYTWITSFSNDIYKCGSHDDKNLLIDCKDENPDRYTEKSGYEERKVENGLLEPLSINISPDTVKTFSVENDGNKREHTRYREFKRCEVYSDKPSIFKEYCKNGNGYYKNKSDMKAMIVDDSGKGGKELLSASYSTTNYGDFELSTFADNSIGLDWNRTTFLYSKKTNLVTVRILGNDELILSCDIKEHAEEITCFHKGSNGGNDDDNNPNIESADIDTINNYLNSKRVYSGYVEVYSRHDQVLAELLLMGITSHGLY